MLHPLSLVMQVEVQNYNKYNRHRPIKAILVLGCKNDGNSGMGGGSITKPGAPREENQSTEQLEAALKELQDNQRSAFVLSKLGVRDASQLLGLDEDQVWNLASQLLQTQAKQVVEACNLTFDRHRYEQMVCDKVDEWYETLRVNSTTNQILNDLGVHSAGDMRDMIELDIWSLAKELRPVEAQQFIHSMDIKWDEDTWNAEPVIKGKRLERFPSRTFDMLRLTPAAKAILDELGVCQPKSVLKLDPEDIWSLARELHKYDAKNFVGAMDMEWDDEKYKPAPELAQPQPQSAVVHRSAAAEGELQPQLDADYED